LAAAAAIRPIRCHVPAGDVDYHHDAGGDRVKAMELGMIQTTRILAGLIAFALPAAASAVALAGGDTRVQFSQAFAGALAGAGVSVGLTGAASLVGPGVNFPITGGDLDASLAGLILHDGSGLTLSNGVNTLALGNFVIDTTAQLLLGDVALNGAPVGTGLSLFSFDLSTVTVAELIDLSNPQLALLATSTAAGALTGAFALPDLSGATAGFAATAPEAVPEPATWGLLILGFGTIGIALRRRNALAEA
jgi:hypothetical protein